jgi:hypothetical protein
VKNKGEEDKGVQGCPLIWKGKGWHRRNWRFTIETPPWFVFCVLMLFIVVSFCLLRVVCICIILHVRRLTVSGNLFYIPVLLVDLDACRFPLYRLWCISCCMVSCNKCKACVHIGLLIYYVWQYTPYFQCLIDLILQQWRVWFMLVSSNTVWQTTETQSGTSSVEDW